MQVTLIYNPHAGGIGDLSSDKLLAALRDAGYAPTYRATQNEGDLDDALAKAENLVVVAGGEALFEQLLRGLSKDRSRCSRYPLVLPTTSAKP